MLAFAGGVLRVESAGRHVMLLGSDDAVSVLVDGHLVYSHEGPRARHPDEDLVAIDLTEGDHAIVLALQRYGRSWTVRARFLDSNLRSPPGGFLLPREGQRWPPATWAPLARITVDRHVEPTGYRPVVHLRYASGWPVGDAWPVRARLTPVPGADASTTEPIVDTELGLAPAHLGDEVEQSFILPLIEGADVEDMDWAVRVSLGEQRVEVPFRPRRAVREAIAHADRALARAQGSSWLTSGSLETLQHLRARLSAFVDHGDTDVSAQLADARELDNLASRLDEGLDPYVPPAADSDGGPREWRTGVMRRAYRSPVDGQLSEFALYVPPDFDPRRRYPLVVALHGMNGHPMQMLMWVFGHDDPDHDGAWEDRHPLRDLEHVAAIVAAPEGHSNAMYRDLGEDDVLRVIDWVTATYPIDPSRVTITGPSMGGIGAAACALRHPDRFAAAEPLCGYHSYFVRSDMAGRPLRPWERLGAEERSNVSWAENGISVPLYVVHGTKDLPEENSGVLIDRYEALHYDVSHEHPELGHNVWQPTYEDLKGLRWLLDHRRALHPAVLRFKTPRTRWADDAWLHVLELASSDSWGEVQARIDGRAAVSLSTRGVAALELDRDPARIDDAAPLHVSVDGQPMVFQAGEPVRLHRDPAHDGEQPWRAGDIVTDRPRKRGHVTGPFHDVFHEPILFVWGATDPVQARANEETARSWARVRWGVRVEYPVISDEDFYARGEPLANDRALFLVGGASSNRVVRDLGDSLPIRIEGDDVVLGSTHISPRDARSPSQLGAAFIFPNPRRPDRYVVVVEGVGPLGTWRSRSLPEMLPDYVVYDEGVAPAHGQPILGAATLRAGGFFKQDWSLPR
jgi:poly(3-hydroxybutyrate) depolymerase